METKKLYICPVTEVCVLQTSAVFMLQASLHEEEAPFVGAKENSFMFDDGPKNPWTTEDSNEWDLWENN